MKHLVCSNCQLPATIQSLLDATCSECGALSTSFSVAWPQQDLSLAAPTSSRSAASTFEVSPPPTQTPQDVGPDKEVSPDAVLQRVQARLSSSQMRIHSHLQQQSASWQSSTPTTTSGFTNISSSVFQPNNISTAVTGGDAFSQTILSETDFHSDSRQQTSSEHTLEYIASRVLEKQRQALQWSAIRPLMQSIPDLPKPERYEPQTELPPEPVTPPVILSVEKGRGPKYLPLPSKPPFLPPDATMQDLSSLMEKKLYRRQLFLWSKFGYPDPDNEQWVMERQLVREIKEPPRIGREHKIIPEDTETGIPIILEAQSAPLLQHVWNLQNRPHGNWTFVGPRNVGGRINSLAISPSDPLHILAGAATGGVWESEDGGKTWRSLFDDQPTMAVGAVAFGSKDSIMYVGTGDPVQLNVEGRGLFRSQNGGKTWQQMDNINLPGIADPGYPTMIRSIAVNPGNDDEVFICTNRGAYYSETAGYKWFGFLNTPDSPWEVVWEPAASPRLWMVHTGRSGHTLLVRYTYAKTAGKLTPTPSILSTFPRLPAAETRGRKRTTWWAGKARFASHPGQWLLAHLGRPDLS